MFRGHVGRDVNHLDVGNHADEQQVKRTRQVEGQTETHSHLVSILGLFSLFSSRLSLLASLFSPLSSRHFSHRKLSLLWLYRQIVEASLSL